MKSFVGDAVSPILLKDLLALAPEVVVPGDGYGGRARPFKPDEVWAGVQLLDAADWAVRQAQEGRREALAFARSFVEVHRLQMQATAVCVTVVAVDSKAHRDSLPGTAGLHAHIKQVHSERGRSVWPRSREA
ncbi:P4HA1 [Symbiodinium necroappetens]|uniref:P4HA1 protein n=1 Tax=Symbiodinium necroappetens TaxID=1628268 RepID=A0A812N546_9DINO|nr:P4HA1 [Symbiodinium necroappetens]